MLKLTKEGKNYLTEGFPEKGLLKQVREKSINIGKVSIKNSAVAIGWARKYGWIIIDQGKVRITTRGKKALREKHPLLSSLKKVSEGKELSEGKLKKLEHRNLVKKVRKGIELPEKITQLTPELLRSGRWRERKLEPYKLEEPGAAIRPGLKHPYRAFLDKIISKLLLLGFKEMCGPPVELSFFNCDALFTPQYHPARSIHDMYFVKGKGSLDNCAKIVKKVKKVHERGGYGSKGWKTKFSKKEAKKLVLRSQGTAVSIRMLLSEKLEIPGKYFSIARCFRPDVIDREHLTEFNHLEGIILGKELSFRNLLGLLKQLAGKTAGTRKVKFKPVAYFPFTEPSVTGYLKHPRLGWIEAMPAGVFRPELLKPLGIKVTVLAWGLGIDRLFMVKTGIDDIRKVFSNDLKWLRCQR